jgi:hypothetical protein
VEDIARRKAEKLKVREVKKAIIRQERAQTAAEGPEQASAFHCNLDTIGLGLTRKGRTRKVPGLGPVTYYPKLAEKRRNKAFGLLAEKGMSYEQF